MRHHALFNTPQRLGLPAFADIKITGQIPAGIVDGDQDRFARAAHMLRDDDLRHTAAGDFFLPDLFAEGTVDCGVIYATDAYSAGMDPVDTATEEMCGKTIYPAAILKGTSDKEAAQAFLDFLQEDDSKKVFEKVGFIPLT